MVPGMRSHGNRSGAWRRPSVDERGQEMRHLIVMIAVALVLAGCGGVSEDGGVEFTTPAPTVQESTSDSTALAENDTDEVDESATTTTTIARNEEQLDESKLPEPAPQPTGEPVTGEVPQDMMTSITTDLLSRTGAEESDITVVRAEQAVWNDGSLGCALPGESYTQAIVNGYWVVFDHAGQTYDYRASSTGFFKLCEGAGQPPSNPTG